VTCHHHPGVQQEPPEIRIKRSGARGEDQRIGGQPLAIGVRRQCRERVVGGARLTLEFPWQPRRMGHEVDKCDLMPIPGRNGHIPADPVLQTVGEPDGPVRRQAGENLTRERFGQRTDTEHRLAVWRLPGAVGGFAKAEHGRLAVAHNADDEGGDPSL